MAQFSNGEGLTNLVRRKYKTEMWTNGRFEHTINVALAGTTDDDVLALLVAGLAAACADTESIRQGLIEVLERHGGRYPQASEVDQ